MVQLFLDLNWGKTGQKVDRLILWPFDKKKNELK